MIAERIITSRLGEEFDGLMYVRTDNEKHRHYSKRLGTLCRRITYVSPSTLKFKWQAHVNTLKAIMHEACLRPRYKNVYMSSLDYDLVFIIMTFQSQATVYTFDDGSLHLSSTVWNKLTNYNGGLLFQFMSKFFRIPNRDELLQRSQKHYTIYRLPNVMPRTEFLPLFEPVQEHTDQAECTVRILMGQNIFHDMIRPFEDSMKDSMRLAQKLIKEYDIDYYFPYPGESDKVLGVKELRSPLVFEDFIFHELEQNPTTHYEVYSFCSSAIINLQGVHPRLSFISIKPDNSPKIFDETYQLIQEAGIPVLPHTLAQ